MQKKLTIFWFRRDLRLEDNAGLSVALKAATGEGVLPIFIFDKNILEALEDTRDARVGFIYDSVKKIKEALRKVGSDLMVFYDYPENVFVYLCEHYCVEGVYANRDYEPYARERDENIKKVLEERGVFFKTFKDHVVFEAHEVLNKEGLPYHVFTPYSKKWREHFRLDMVEPYDLFWERFFKPKENFDLLDLKDMGFLASPIMAPALCLERGFIEQYDVNRNKLCVEGQTNLGTYLRFGRVGVRQVLRAFWGVNDVFVNELIWREFFQMILFYYPQNVVLPFQKKFEKVEWLKGNEAQERFAKWCEGRTGFLIVDAGMHQLNETGLMHNRVRMIVANFLTKILFIDWRWGEAYFAKKLLDFELASNNGNWQWAAGCGCDAAPYFRVFNPFVQQDKFDAEKIYLRRWLGEDFEKGGKAFMVSYDNERKAYLAKMKTFFL